MFYCEKCSKEEKKQWRKCKRCDYQNYIYLSDKIFTCERCGNKTATNKD